MNLITKPIRYVLRALGVTQQVKRQLLSERIMKFPTFDPSVNESLIFESDYFRYATIGLALRRAVAEGVEGSLAEAGVYRGDMSSFIHRIAPDRRLYLFDTFGGFPEGDLEPGAVEVDRFRDTSVDIVMKNLGDVTNVVIKKGLVPGTFRGLEGETFAFVLLDLDLHDPTLRSLEFFYPRLVSGGYLVLHDYNSTESGWACKRAMDEFMEDKPERLIDIADVFGTVLFRKR